MKKFNKIIAITLVLIMSMITLLGCSPKDDSSEKVADKKEQVTLWLPPFGSKDKEVWKPILNKFEEKNNCEVSLEIIPWDHYIEKYTAAIVAGEGPDVGYMYAEMFPDFIDMGAVADIDKYVTDEDKENYIYIDEGLMMGGRYGLPFCSGYPAVLYYNKDILDELGEKAPETWEDFRRIAIKATKDTDGDGKIDQWGYAPGWGRNMFGDLNWLWYGFLWQSGGHLFNEDITKVAFDSKEGIETAEFIYDLKAKDKVIPETAMSMTSKEMLENYFVKGNAAFIIYKTTVAGKLFDKEYSDLNYGWVPALTYRDSKTKSSIDQLTLMESSQNKELAFELMRYITSAESMNEFHKYVPWPPLTKQEEYGGDPKFKEMRINDADKFRPLRVAPKGHQIYDYLFKQLQLMMNGEKTPEQALKDAAEYGNETLDNYYKNKK